MAEPQKIPGFKLITDEPEAPKQDNSAALKILLVALGALTQRTLIAISDLYSLLAVGSVFWLFLSISSPTPYQLVELGMYGAFVLASIIFVKVRR